MEFFYSPIKLINNTKPIIKARQDYDIIANESQLFQQSLLKFQIAFNELTDIPNIEVSTDENTSLDKIIKDHLQSLNNFHKAFQAYSISLKNDYESFISNDGLCQYERECQDKEIISINDEIIKMLDKTVKGNFLEIHNQLRDKIKELNKLIKNKSKGKPVPEIQNQYIHYRLLYGKYRLIHTKLNKNIDKLHSLIKGYLQRLKMTSYSRRAQLVSKELRLVSNHLDELGCNIENSVSTLEKDKLNFKDDFTKFIDQKSIEFTTFPNNFEIDKYHRKSFQLDTSDKVFIWPNYRKKIPDHIVKLKANFTGQNLNELTVTKGQKVGILSEKENFDGWSLCLNLLNEKVGYLPTAYLEKVGKGIVVVKNDLDFDSLESDRGRMLAFIEQKGNEVVCEDYFGNRATVPLEKVIILESCLQGTEKVATPSEKLSESLEKVDNLNEDSIMSSFTFDSSLYMNLSDFEKVCRIKKGHFSVVEKYKRKGTDEYFAFKIINLILNSNSSDAQNMIKDLRREIVISSAFNDPMLHSLYGIIDDLAEKSRFILITHFYSKGD